MQFSHYEKLVTGEKETHMNHLIIAAVLAVFGAAVTAPDVSAHSGRTDKNGCHNDNKNGGRHCH